MSELNNALFVIFLPVLIGLPILLFCWVVPIVMARKKEKVQKQKKIGDLYAVVAARVYSKSPDGQVYGDIVLPVAMKARFHIHLESKSTVTLYAQHCSLQGRRLCVSDIQCDSHAGSYITQFRVEIDGVTVTFYTAFHRDVRTYMPSEDLLYLLLQAAKAIPCESE